MKTVIWESWMTGGIVVIESSHCYIQSLLHTVIVTYSHCYIQSLLHTTIVTYSHCYIQSLIHIVIATYSHCYIQSLLHSHCYIQSLLHTDEHRHNYLLKKWYFLLGDNFVHKRYHHLMCRYAKTYRWYLLLQYFHNISKLE